MKSQACGYSSPRGAGETDDNDGWQTYSSRKNRKNKGRVAVVDKENSGGYTARLKYGSSTERTKKPLGTRNTAGEKGRQPVYKPASQRLTAYKPPDIGSDKEDKVIVDKAFELYKNKEKLWPIRPEDERLVSFEKSNAETVAILLKAVSNSKNPRLVNHCLHMLLEYAQVFSLSGDNERSFFWYWKIYSEYYGKLTQNQKKMIDANLLGVAEVMISVAYHSGFWGVKSHNVPENFDNVVKVCESRELFDRLGIRYQMEGMACIYKWIVLGSYKDKAIELIDNLSFEKIIGYFDGYEFSRLKDTLRTATMICLIYWPAVLTTGCCARAGEITPYVHQVLGRRRKSENKLWKTNNIILLGYYELMFKTLRFFSLANDVDDVKIAKEFVDDLRSNGLSVYRDQERYNKNLIFALQEYARVLIHRKEVDALKCVYKEICQLESPRLELSERTLCLGADIERIIYTTRLPHEPGNPSQIKQYIQILTERYFSHLSSKEGEVLASKPNPMTVLCLGELYVALDKKEEAENIFQYYDGKVAIGYRKRARNLQEMGEYEKAFDILFKLEEQGYGNKHIIQLEYAICLSRWAAVCDGVNQQDKFKRAISSLKKAMKNGPANWRDPWASFGHVLQGMESITPPINFHNLRQDLPYPLNGCTFLGDAITGAFKIAKASDVGLVINIIGSEKKEVRRMIDIDHFSELDEDEKKKKKSSKYS